MNQDVLCTGCVLHIITGVFSLLSRGSVETQELCCDGVGGRVGAAPGASPICLWAPAPRYLMDSSFLASDWSDRLTAAI